ncbi:MAG: hypothetical protein FD165_2494 [Gammaproteobacteria bacterium]|nr:MAG: hypothetical protein FD165_2494 [Gammaproteobacteria bacterium]TND02919.1 MAG: hypothetical protein FD120_1988 [Gammaproteobacteria bacterium]
MKLAVKVVPGASRDGIAGWLGDALKVRVTAPPEHGKANTAVEEIVADVLGIPAGHVRIVTGKSAARKVIEIDGLSEAEVYRLLPGQKA